MKKSVRCMALALLASMAFAAVSCSKECTCKVEVMAGASQSVSSSWEYTQTVSGSCRSLNNQVYTPVGNDVNTITTTCR